MKKKAFLFAVMSLALVLTTGFTWSRSRPPLTQEERNKRIARQMVAGQEHCSERGGKLWVGTVLLDSLETQNAVKLSLSNCVRRSTKQYPKVGVTGRYYDLVVCPISPQDKVFVEYIGRDGGVAHYKSYFVFMCAHITIAGGTPVKAGIVPPPTSP